MEERSFILKYRQATPQGQELARQKLREAAARSEQNRYLFSEDLDSDKGA